MSETPLIKDVTELRLAFDQSFAKPPALASATSVNLLSIRVAGEPYAIRVDEISRLVAGGRITPVPSPTPNLLGIAGIKGRFIAAYSLAMMLGYPRGGENPKWLAVCGKEKAFGLAFAEFEHLFQVPMTAFSIQPNELQAMKFASVIINTGTESRPVINIPMLVHQIISGTNGGLMTIPSKGAS